MKTSRLAALISAFALGACSVAQVDSPDTLGQDTATAPPDDADAATAQDVRDTLVPAEARWHTVLSGLPAALLSATGSAPYDMWFTGADKGDGGWVIHGTEESFRRLDLRDVDPEGGDIWWAALPDATWVYLVGEGGRIFRYNRASDVVEAVPSNTDATLYGVWGASAAEMWAVGGYVHPRTGPPTIVRIVDGVGEVVTGLPAELADDTTLFKVWGSGPEDVWVVGEKGTVLRWDGEAWSIELLDGAPRLVTLHGASADDMVVVGGASQAIIWERRDGGAWTDVSPGPYPLLNGVYVAPDGTAIAVGLLGQAFTRDAAGAWTPASDVPLLKDWHAAWVDPRGDAWLVGGNLLSASTFNDGALLRWGPDRTDLPGPPVIDYDDEPDVVEAEADVVEGEPDAAASDASPGDTASVDDAAGPDDAAEPGDAAEPDDAMVADIGPEDTAAPTDATGADVTSPFDPELELGEVSQEGDFSVLTPDQPIEIVQGIQGGIHLEVGARFTWPGDEHPLMTYVLLTVEIDGVEEARFLTLGYPVPRVAPNVYRTYTIPVIFTTNLADPFVGKTATLKALIRLPDDSERTAEIDLTLVDAF